MWRSETNGASESFNIVRKGYDREAVDRLLVELRQQVTQASAKIAQLEAELAQTRHDYTTLREDTRLALSDPERASKLLGQEASEVLKSANDAALGLRRKAESTAKDLVERARREAEEITRQAKLATEAEIEEGRQVARAHLEEVRQQGREILAMADSTASNTVEAAKREGRSLVFRAREHAANLTQQAENRAAQIREEISGLDLERQHLIGMLRSAQDLLKNSLSALDRRTPITMIEHNELRPQADETQQAQLVTATANDETTDNAAATTTGAASTAGSTQGDDQELQGPLTIEDHEDLASQSSLGHDDDALPEHTGGDDGSAGEFDAEVDTNFIDRQPQELAFADVARLIELATQQTAALELEDEDEHSVDESNDAPSSTSELEVPSMSPGAGPSSMAQAPSATTDEQSLQTEDADRETAIAELATTSLETHESGPADQVDPTLGAASKTEQPANHHSLDEDFEDEAEIVVVERYRQPRPPTSQEDSKSRLQRLEALFGELRDEGVVDEADAGPVVVADLTAVIVDDNGTPEVMADARATSSEADVAPSTSEDGSDLDDHDQLAHKIQGALHELFDPRTVDLSRRVKRITQDDLNRILATIRSNGRSGALAIVEQLMNDSEGRINDVRLLVARVVHAGSDFAAVLGGRSFDPAGDRFDNIVEETALELTDVLGQATLARAFTTIDNNADGDEADLVALTNGIYREARRQLDELINDVAYRAFSRGARLVPGATGYLWITSSSSQPCADCEDNMLAGINPIAEAFPTGHENPPAHPGCTCVIVPVFA
jgi:hypothetical protein